MGRAPRSIDIDIDVDRSIDCPMPIVRSHVRTGIISKTYEYEYEYSYDTYRIDHT